PPAAGAPCADAGAARLPAGAATGAPGRPRRPVRGLGGGVALGARPRRRRRGDAELLETGLEMDPQLMGLLTRGALGIGLIGAEEYVPARPGDRERFCDVCEALRRVHERSEAIGILPIAPLRVGWRGWEVQPSTTTTFARIHGWGRQKYSYSPTSSNVKLQLSPVLKNPESKLPSTAVTVCI